MLDDRWLVKSLLGKGSYRKVYHSTDLECPIDAALKVEPQNDQKPWIKMAVIWYSWTWNSSCLLPQPFSDISAPIHIHCFPGCVLDGAAYYIAPMLVQLKAELLQSGEVSVK